MICCRQVKYGEKTMSEINAEIAAIESRAQAIDQTMSFVCRWADIPPSTWGHWKSGRQGPTKAKWDKIVAAITDLERRLERETQR